MSTKVLCHHRDSGVHGERGSLFGTRILCAGLLRADMLRTILLVLFLLYSASTIAAEVILKEIHITARDEDTKIDIDLGTPLEYVKHFPQSFGEIIQIQLKLPADQGRGIHKEVRQGNELKTPAGAEPLLIYVTYEEGVPGGPYLTLRFVKPVRFHVEAQPSPTHLSITVFGEPKKEATIPPVEQIVEGQEAQPAVVQPHPRDADLGQLMAKARQALTFGDNESAIRLLRKIIAASGNPHEQDARELLHAFNLNSEELISEFRQRLSAASQKIRLQGKEVPDTMRNVTQALRKGKVHATADIQPETWIDALLKGQIPTVVDFRAQFSFRKLEEEALSDKDEKILEDLKKEIEDKGKS